MGWRGNRGGGFGERGKALFLCNGMNPRGGGVTGAEGLVKEARRLFYETD